MFWSKLSSQERRGLLVVSLFALLLLVVMVVLNLTDTYDDTVKQEPRRPNYYKPFASEEQVTPETFHFDPNTADSTALLRLGFPAYMVRGIYRYRARGGRYHMPEDLSHIPGMTHELYDRLLPYVVIGEEFRYMKPVSSASYRSREHDTTSVVQERSEVRYNNKLRQGERVLLNRADTTELKRIPGIGSYYSRKIVEYRERLGGFVSLSQLKDKPLENLPEDISEWVVLDTAGIVRMNVNKATRKQLVRHPYISPYQAQMITEYVHNFGLLHNIEEVRQLNGFSDSDARRLAPYLLFR